MSSQDIEVANNNQPNNNSTLQGKRWMLTINNPTFSESETLYRLGHNDKIDCLVYGAEHTEEGQGTPHFQIYIHFKSNWRFNRVKEMFPRARIELAKKPKLACCRYCAKEHFYYAFGNVPDLNSEPRGYQAAKRKAEDMAREEIVQNIMKGKTRMIDLTAEQLLDQKLVRACEKASSMIQGPMRDDVYVCCFVSPTGWGKSYSIWETFLRLASVEFGASQEWFLDAEQEVMLFDEFCGQIRAQKMLKYLDPYPISLPIKGGHRPCYWKLIFICSNTSPDEWYMRDDPKTGIRVSSIPEEVRKALYRRIGYPEKTARGETHVYSATFTDLTSARNEMKKICVELHHKLYPEGMPSPLNHEDPDVNQAVMEIDRMEAIQADKAFQKELPKDFDEPEFEDLLKNHGINIHEEEQRWDRAREIQKEREAHEFDDLPDLEPDPETETPPSAQDPTASVPKIDEDYISSISDDDDSDFEK